MNKKSTASQPTSCTLIGLDVSGFKACYITKDLAMRAGIHRVDTVDGAALVGRKPKANVNYAGIVFPYFWPGVAQPRGHRLRRDHPDLKQQPGGIAKEEGKYLTAAGSRNHFYFPPDTNPSWLQDISIKAVFVEGEKKALAASRFFAEQGQQVLVIAVSGAWNWRGVVGKTTTGNGSRRDVKGLIPDFDHIEWKGREVEIVFDADTRTNNGVSAGRRELAKELTWRGGGVRIFEMPDAVETGAKGLDDLLYIKGPNFVADWLQQERQSTYPVRTTAKAQGVEFEIKAEGVFALEQDSNGAPHPIFVCSPLYIEADTFDEEGRNWGRLLRWEDRAGNQHWWAMPMSLLKGDGQEYRGELLDRGVTLGGRKAREYLAVYLNTKPNKQALSVSRIGWQRGAYVLPDGCIGAPDGQEIYLQTNSPNPLLKIAGTLEEWRNEIASYCIGNTRLAFAVSTAFAAVLLKPLSSESGGFHFRGLTSTGKTTLLLAAGSVWGGNGDKSYIHRWRATANGLEAVAEAHNDGLLNLDELSEVDAREAGEVAYLLANGAGKTRQTKNITLRRSLEWRLLFLSSGEISLADHVATAGKLVRGGQEIRLIDLPADAGKGSGVFDELHGFSDGDQFSRHLKEAAARYYGTAIREFLRRVVADDRALHTEYQNFAEAFRKDNLPKNAAGEVMRAVNRFALVAFAGELASDFGITGWIEHEAETAASALFKEWLANRGEMGTDEDRAIRQVQRFFELHGQSRFQPLPVPLNADGSDGKLEKILNRAGYVEKTDDDGLVYYVLPQNFRSEVCAGFDYQLVAKALNRRGWLQTSCKLQYEKRLPEGRMKVYALLSKMLE